MRKSFYVIAILFTIFTFSSSAQNITFKWSPKVESAALLSYKAELKRANIPEEHATTIATCALQKLKAKFPNGVNLPKAEFQRINKANAKECAKQLKIVGVPVWNVTAEASLKKAMLNKFPDSMPQETKNQLADCMIGKLKVKYPKGFISNAETKEEIVKEIQVISIDCIFDINYLNVSSWTSEREKFFKSYFKNQLPKDYSEEEKNVYSECIFAKLKEKYPNGLPNEGKDKQELRDFIRQTNTDCTTEAKKK